MAYVGNTSQLCQAIVDNNFEIVKQWFGSGGDVNHRDHAGRTPLHLAVVSSSPEIVQCLIDHGARLVSRIYNGMTALHMAAHRGNASLVRILLDKSIENENAERQKENLRKKVRRANWNDALAGSSAQASHDSDVEIVYGEEEDKSEEGNLLDDTDSQLVQDGVMTEDSFVEITMDNQFDAESVDEPDFYSVDVLAWDAPVSPLHLAIMAGHIDVINVLIDSFGANALLPVKIMTDRVPREPRAAILSLLFSLQLPPIQARDTVASLLKRGASLAQADMNGISALHYIVSEGKIRVLDQIQTMRGITDQDLINHLVITDGRYETSVVTNPLQTAIMNGSLEMSQRIISMGAKPEIEFERFARAWSVSNKNAPKDPEEMIKIFRTSVDQPVIWAAWRNNFAAVVKQLIELGADVNSLTKEAHQAILKPTAFRDDSRKSLLDLVRERVKELQTFGAARLQEGSRHYKPVRPTPLSEEAFASLQEGGHYRTWLARGNIASAKQIYDLQIKECQQNLKRWNPNPEVGAESKKSAVRRMLTEYVALEEFLVSKGAKSYQDLLPPDARENPDDENACTNLHLDESNEKDKTYKNRLTFLLPDLTKTKKAAYFELFEASFVGDTETVRLLCLKGINGTPPLQVAVQDLAGFSPFSVAVIRGHHDLATIILDIAISQYEPIKDGKTDLQYTMHNPHVTEFDDYTSNDEEDTSIRIYKEPVNYNFTIEDVRVLSSNAKSRVSPTTMLLWECEIWRAIGEGFDSEEVKASLHGADRDLNGYGCGHDICPWSRFNTTIGRKSIRCRWSLFRYALAQNDTSILSYLLLVSRKVYHMENKDATLTTLQLSDNDIDFAMQLGRTEMIGDIISNTGAMLPLQNMIQKSGVQLEGRPGQYKGLSVYGKKRTDWAEAGRGFSTRCSSYSGSPILRAIFQGNIESIEYFFSDTPLRQYQSFVEDFEDDGRIQKWTEVDGGIQKTIRTWMDTRLHLSLHIAVMTDRQEPQLILRYLLQKLPQRLDAKNERGITPLQLAIRLDNHPAASFLISAGADQKCRNHHGENLMHTIYSHRTRLRFPSEPSMSSDFMKFVSLLNADVIPILLRQRCQWLQTPLASYFHRRHLSFNDLDEMLRLSGGKDLEIMDRYGDYLLHYLIRYGTPELAEYIATKAPHTLFWENATGMTPIEVADTAKLASRMKFPPTLERGDSRHCHQSDILRWPAYTFLENNINVQEKPPHHTFLCQIAATHARPRKLVSLLDANEVARRLAEDEREGSEELRIQEALGFDPYSCRHRFYEPLAEVHDEVSRWMDEALKRAHLDD